MPQDSDSGDTKISMAKANRKIAKPIMEKKRRARINASLNELKTLLVEVLQKEGCRHSSKMEKADILEMAVRHLKNLQKQQTFPGAPTHTLRDSYPPAIPIEKYVSAISPECLPVDVKRYIGRSMSTESKSSTTPTSPDSTVSSPTVKLDCNRNIVAAPQPINISTSVIPVNNNPMSTATPTVLPAGLNALTQPMMTRTSSGEIAVVLPQHILKQAAGHTNGGIILPLYNLQQNQALDTKVPISQTEVQGAPQPMVISINMPSLQQSQGSAFSSLPSSSSTSSSTSSHSSAQAPVSPVWRPW